MTWRREIAAAWRVAAGVTLSGAAGGAIWGLLAPPQQYFVVRPGRGVLVTGEEQHPFNGIAIFICIGVGLGFLSAVLAWRWRRGRGPGMVLGLLAGSGAAAVVMKFIGEGAAELRHPHMDASAVNSVIIVAAQVESWGVVIAQPLLAALVVLFAAAVSPGDDLGVASVRQPDLSPSQPDLPPS
jgi:hypothetical protein